MSGLREKQKAQRRRAIEQSAAELFVEKGFDNATIEDIADRALVSVATVYNYYGTKGELLLALVARGEEGVDARHAEFMARARDDDPVELVSDVIFATIDATLVVLSRELWGHVVAFVATNTNPAIAKQYFDTISEGLGHNLSDVLSEFIRHGRIRQVDTMRFAQMLTRLERNHFLDFVYFKDRTLNELRQGIRRDVALIINEITT